MNTVGYGDIYPTNLLETVYTIIMMISSGIVYAYSINEIGNILKDRRKMKKQYIQDSLALKHYFSQEQVSQDLQRRIYNYLLFIHNNNNEMQRVLQQQALKKLPENLQLKLKQEIVSKHMKNLPLLTERYSQNLLNLLISKTEEKRFFKGDIIYQQKQHENLDLYYIVQGQVSLYFNKSNLYSKENAVSKKIQGDYFGEFSFFSGLPREGTVQATTACEVYQIKREDFLKILKENIKDYELFCNLRDNIQFKQQDFQKKPKVNKKNLEKGYQYYEPLGQKKYPILKCFSCKKQGHLTSECGKTFQVFNKQLVISNYQYNCQQKQQRLIFFRPKRIFILTKIGSQILTPGEQNDLQEDNDKIYTRKITIQENKFILKRFRRENKIVLINLHYLIKNKKNIQNRSLIQTSLINYSLNNLDEYPSVSSFTSCENSDLEDYFDENESDSFYTSYQSSLNSKLTESIKQPKIQEQQPFQYPNLNQKQDQHNSFRYSSQNIENNQNQNTDTFSSLSQKESQISKTPTKPKNDTILKTISQKSNSKSSNSNEKSLKQVITHQRVKKINQFVDNYIEENQEDKKLLNLKKQLTKITDIQDSSYTRSVSQISKDRFLVQERLQDNKLKQLNKQKSLISHDYKNAQQLCSNQQQQNSQISFQDFLLNMNYKKPEKNFNSLQSNEFFEELQPKNKQKKTFKKFKTLGQSPKRKRNSKPEKSEKKKELKSMKTLQHKHNAQNNNFNLNSNLYHNTQQQKQQQYQSHIYDKDFKNQVKSIENTIRDKWGKQDVVVVFLNKENKQEKEKNNISSAKSQQQQQSPLSKLTSPAKINLSGRKKRSQSRKFSSLHDENISIDNQNFNEMSIKYPINQSVLEINQKKRFFISQYNDNHSQISQQKEKINRNNDSNNQSFQSSSCVKQQDLKIQKKNSNLENQVQSHERRQSILKKPDFILNQLNQKNQAKFQTQPENNDELNLNDQKNQDEFFSLRRKSRQQTSNFMANSIGTTVSNNKLTLQLNPLTNRFELIPQETDLFTQIGGENMENMQNLQTTHPQILKGLNLFISSNINMDELEAVQYFIGNVIFDKMANFNYYKPFSNTNITILRNNRMLNKKIFEKEEEDLLLENQPFSTRLIPYSKNSSYYQIRKSLYGKKSNQLSKYKNSKNKKSRKTEILINKSQTSEKSQNNINSFQNLPHTKNSKFITQQKTNLEKQSKSKNSQLYNIDPSKRRSSVSFAEFIPENRFKKRNSSEIKNNQK